MSFPLDKLSDFLCWQYEQNHTKQLATCSSLAPALATIVVREERRGEGGEGRRRGEEGRDEGIRRGEKEEVGRGGSKGGKEEGIGREEELGQKSNP